MIYSRSCEYAIRAFIHLSQAPDGKFTMARQIADEEEIPAHFLAKILQQLTRKGLLRSSKGPSGGFRLGASPADVRLLDIVSAIDGMSAYETCLAGLPKCSNKSACPLHDGWTALRSRIMEFLGRNTIESLAKTLERKRRARKRHSEKKRSRAGRAARGNS
jgi:Rrf2 family protein